MKTCFQYMRFLIFILSFTLVILSPVQTVAFSVDTHRAINEKTADKNSFLHQYLINQLGWNNGVETEINEKWIAKHIGDGGVREDAGGRSVNHFHNPLTNRGLFGNYSAMIWATLPAGAQQLQNYSWNDVRDYYFQALTAREKTKRDNWFALTFRGVGQIMHLVQDMSVPAHVKSLSFP